MMSASPARRNCMAVPIAWLEEAQALDVTKQGPVAPDAIETQLAEELTMTLATVIGCGRLFWV